MLPCPTYASTTHTGATCEDRSVCCLCHQQLSYLWQIDMPGTWFHLVVTMWVHLLPFATRAATAIRPTGRCIESSLNMHRALHLLCLATSVPTNECGGWHRRRYSGDCFSRWLVSHARGTGLCSSERRPGTLHEVTCTPSCQARDQVVRSVPPTS